LVKTLSEPLEASVSTSPIRVKRFPEVVSSRHEQIADGAANPACAQTPVVISQTLALLSVMYDLFNNVSSPKTAWANSQASVPTAVNCSASKAVFIVLTSATTVAK